MGITEDHESTQALIAEDIQHISTLVIETTFASKRELLVGLQYKMRDGTYEILERETTGDSIWPFIYKARKID